MSKKKNVLIVGGGSIGKKHYLVAKKNDEIGEVKIVGQREFDVNIDLIKGNEFKAVVVRMVGFIPDIAIVAGPATSHIRTASALITIGIHILIEKPLANSVNDLQDFYKLVESGDVCVTIGYNLRFMQSLQFFKETTESGIAGRIRSVRAEVGQYLPDWRPNTDYRKSVSASAALGGGVLLELSHEIDYLQWIFGRVKTVSAWSFHCSDLDIDVEDTAHILLFFQERKENLELIASLTLDFIRKDASRSCTAIGDLSTLRWDGITDTVSLFDSKSKQWRILYQGSRTSIESYEHAFEHFLDLINQKTTLCVTPCEGIATLNVIEAIRISSQHQCRKTCVEM